MALSLAACGSSDDTSDAVSYTQAQLDAAKLTATAAAEAAAVTAATAASATAATAQAAAVSAAEATAATAATAAAAAAATAQTAAVTAATTAAEAAAATAQSAAVSLALRNAAAEAGATTFDGMSDAAMIEAIKSSDNDGIADAAVAALGISGISSLSALNTAYTAAIAPSTVTTFSLTANTDNVSGSGSDDTITGSSTTFNSDDTINGGDGNDTFTVTAAGAGSAIGNFSNTETLNITNGGANNTSYAINLIGASGVTTVANRLSSGDVDFQNNQALVTVKAYGSQAGSDTKASFLNTLASGATDSLSLVIDGGGTTTFHVSGTTDTNEFETLNISSAGATANTITAVKDYGGNDTASLATVNVSGSAALSYTMTGGATGASYNAASADGAQTAVWGGNFATITGGTGADKIDLSAGSFLGSTAPKTVDGKDGTDTVVFAEDVNSLVSNTATTPHSITNVENLEIEGKLADGGVADLARIVEADLIAGVNTIQIDASNLDATAGGGNGEDVSITVNDISGEAVEIQFIASGTATNDENVTLNLLDDTGAADSVSIKTLNPSATTVTSITTLTVDRSATNANNLVETVNLELAASDVSTTDGTTIGTLDATYTGTVNITGSGDATIGAIEVRDPAGTGTAVINAGTHTGNLTLSTLFKATAADTMAITLGSGTNVIDFSTEALTADSVTATAGTADTVKIKEGATALAMTINGVEDLEITGATASKEISAANWTNVETIELRDGGVDDTTGDNISLTNIAANQAIEIYSTSTSSADWDGGTITLNGAATVNALAVTVTGGVALEGTGTISVDTSSLSITDNNTAAATGYYFDQTIVLAGTTISGQTVDVNSLTLSGGGSSSATATAVTTLTGTTNLDIDTLNASAFANDLVITGLDTGTGAAITLGGGNNKVTIALADAARDAVDINGGDGSDTLVFADMATGTYRPGVTNVEILDVDTEDAAGNSGAITLHLGDASSITEVQLDLDLNDENVTVAGASSVSKYVLAGDATATTDLISLGSAGTVVITNEAALGGNAAVALTTADATNMTFKQGHSSDQAYLSVTAAAATSLTMGGNDADTAGTAYAGALTMTTLTAGALTSLAVDSNQGDRTVSTLTANKLAAVTIVGDNATSLGATAATTGALASIDGSTSTGGITIGAGIDLTSSADVKLGTAADTITLDILTESNVVVAAGEVASGTDVSDTLLLAGANNQGLTVVDLSSSTDQVTQINGAINGAAQTNFEAFTASGLTGSFGVSVTGSAEANTIIGTANADTIVAGAGIDVVTAGAGNDTVSFTETTSVADTFHFSTAATNGSDTVTGFISGTDVLNVELLAAGNIAAEHLQAANAAAEDIASATFIAFADGADGTGAEAITDYTSTTDVAAFLAGGLTEAEADIFGVLINDLSAKKAYVYNVDVSVDTGTNNRIDAGDVSLLATIDIDAGLVLANIDFTA
jgi:hypothetical protein